MGITSYPKLLGFLRRLAKAPADPDADVPGVLARRGLPARRGGAVYDAYEPAEGKARSPIVAVQGATRRGARDPRLVHFARCLARSGHACLVPHLPALSSGTFVTDDLDHIEAVISEAATTRTRPVGLVGFSFGASFALVAAARPAVADVLGAVVAVGGYHDLGALFASHLAARDVEPAMPAAWDEAIYLRLYLARPHLDALGIDRSVLPELEDLLARYCTTATPEEKRRFHDVHLAHRPVLETGLAGLDPRLLAALSPAGKLGGVRCPVSIVHSRSDTLVPPDHAVRLHAELVSATPDEQRHQLLITSLLEHVDLREALNPLAVGRLLGTLSPILELR